MSPTLEVGDVVRVVRTRIAISGDVMVFRSGAVLVCHRALLVLHRRNGSIMLHVGDAPGAGIGVVSSSTLLGVVSEVRRNGSPAFEPLTRRSGVRPRELLAFVLKRLVRSARPFIRSASSVASPTPRH